MRFWRFIGFASFVAVVAATTAYAVDASMVTKQFSPLLRDPAPPSEIGPVTPYQPFCRAINYGEGEAFTRRNQQARHVVVPAGPVEMHVCRYWGDGVRRQTKKTQARAGKLARERQVLKTAYVRSIAGELDRTRPAPGSYACPFSDGSNLYAMFSYQRHPAVIVEAELGGCRFVNNDFGQGGFPPSRVLHRLERLTKLPSSH
jgi:hypothetical protein